MEWVTIIGISSSFFVNSSDFDFFYDKCLMFPSLKFLLCMLTFLTLNSFMINAFFVLSHIIT